jgi:hypothetical protein
LPGERAEWSSQRHCDHSRWHQQIGRASGNKEEIKILNQYLDAIQAKIYQVQKEYALRNEPVTASEVRAKILHKTEEKKYSLIEVYHYHNDQFEKLVGSEFCCPLLPLIFIYRFFYHLSSFHAFH